MPFNRFKFEQCWATLCLHRGLSGIAVSDWRIAIFRDSPPRCIKGFEKSGLGKGKAEGPDDGRIFPADPLPLEALAAIDADLTIEVGGRAAGGLDLANLELGAKLVRGQLVISKVRIRLAGGEVLGAATVDSSGDARGAKRAKIEVGVHAKGVGVGELDITDKVVMPVDVKLRVQGSGASVRALMAGLDGSVSVVAGEVTIDTGPVDLIAPI